METSKQFEQTHGKQFEQTHGTQLEQTHDKQFEQTHGMQFEQTPGMQFEQTHSTSKQFSGSPPAFVSRLGQKQQAATAARSDSRTLHCFLKLGY